MIHLVPNAGKHVRDPKSKKKLGPEGIQIEAIDTYWHRRLQDGSVRIAEAPAPAKPAQPKKESKEKGV